MALILSLITGITLAMLIHELGHVFAARRCDVSASEIGFGVGPRLFSFSARNLKFTLKIFPLASFVRLDGTALIERSVWRQLFVHLGGIFFNLAAASVAQGTLFGRLNLLLALANLLPLYQHDGWKCGVVLMRALLRKQSRPVEWVFTFSGGVASLVIISSLIHVFK